MITARKIQDTVNSHMFQIDDNSIQITISIGLIEYSHDFIHFDHMMKSVDNAIYYSKEHGRNQIHIGGVSSPTLKDTLT